MLGVGAERAGHHGHAAARADRRAVVQADALAARTEAIDALGTDPDDHAPFPRAEVRVLVLAQVLLRKHVDVLEGALLDDLGCSAHYHVAALLVLGGKDGSRRSRFALDALDLRPSGGALDEHILPVVLDPG